MQAGSKKIDEMLGIFEFFITGDWHYENKNIYSVLAKMSPEEREEFNCDVRQIDFTDFLANYIKGLSIWCLHEDNVAPDLKYQQMILKNKYAFDDWKETIKHQKNFVAKYSTIYEAKILSKSRFDEYFR